VRARREFLGRVALRLQSPAARIARARGDSGVLAQRLSAAGARALERRRDALERLSARLEAVSYEATLKRGFALVEDGSGTPMTRAAAVKPGAKLKLLFGDGSVGATADAPSRQGSLF
jgi:exodeoxyribonuclease VII large subunit